MKHVAYSLLLAISILLYGCPYESSLPLDNQEIQIDSSLIGYWGKLNKIEYTTKADSLILSVRPLGQKAYYMIFIRKAMGDPAGYNDTIRATVHESLVNNRRFLNVHKMNSEKYWFVEMKINNGLIDLLPIDESLTPQSFYSSKTLKDFILDYMKTKELPVDKENMKVGLKKLSNQFLKIR